MATMTLFGVFSVLSTFGICMAINTEITFNLPEDLPNGTLIGSIADESDLLSEVSPNDIPLLEYNILDTTNVQAMSLFTLSPSTGKLFTAAIVDREDVCKLLLNCVITFDVAVSTEQTEFFQLITVKINITDINDNAPTFDEKEITLNISEDVQKGKLFTLGSVLDLDTGPYNSVQTYQLFPSNIPFILSEEKTIGGSILSIAVNERLDREQISHYEVYVLAKDGGTPQRTGRLTVKINVLDENDNRPIFENSSITLSVKEDTPINTVIVTLTATDKDSGRNGQILYRLSSHQPEEIYSLFAINATTGDLRLVEKLSYERGKVYRIFVQASDLEEQTLFTQAIVNVNIIDTKNNPPIVKLNLRSHGTSGIVEMSEGANLGTFVAHVNVEDTDTGANGHVFCTTFSTYFGLESLDDNKGYKVVVQHKLDRETIIQHNVTINCRDEGTPVLDSSASFLVQVTDENDNPPRFFSDDKPMYYYSKSVSENNKIGQSVIQVFAVDKDQGDNAKVTYSIKPSSDTRFRINPQSGEVDAMTTFDRETASQVSFMVLARDGGSTPLEATATVVLEILDVNDNKPRFKEDVLEFEVAENMPIGTFIDQVTAVDGDQGENGTVVYELAAEYVSAVPFEVFLDGTMVTNKELNREIQSRYDFVLRARDNGSVPLNSTVQVVVTVTDDNDNKPVIKFPTPSNYTVSILYTSPVNSVVTVVLADDIDEGLNGELLFSIVNGNDDNLFSINPTTGKLYLRKQLKTLTQDKIYTLTISVKDKGEVSRETTRDLRVVLKYTNETSFPLPPGEEEGRNMLIAVSVVCVTFILSIAIIAVICIIRRRDKDKAMCGIIRSRGNGGSGGPGSQKSPMPHMELANDKTYPDDAHRKGKKEVSFSLDEDEDNFSNELNISRVALSSNQKYTQLGHTSSPIPMSSSPFDQPFVDLVTGKPLTPRRSSQTLPPTQTKLPDTADKQIKQHLEDRHSETSGETTTTSDSGHGGSEEDVHSHDGPRSFDMNPLHLHGKDAPSIYVITTPTKDLVRTSLSQPGQSVARTNINQNHRRTMEDKQSLQRHHSENIQSPSDLWTQLYINNNKFGGSHGHEHILYAHDPLGNQSLYSENLSRDDDDMTTTSGSYTLNPDDLDDEFPVRDLLV